MILELSHNHSIHRSELTSGLLQCFLEFPGVDRGCIESNVIESSNVPTGCIWSSSISIRKSTSVNSSCSSKNFKFSLHLHLNSNESFENQILNQTKDLTESSTIGLENVYGDLTQIEGDNPGRPTTTFLTRMRTRTYLTHQYLTWSPFLGLLSLSELS